MSVSTKLNIAIIGIPLASLITSFFVLSWYAQKITLDVYQTTAKELIENYVDKIDSKKRVGITNAISIANNSKIKEALLKDKREYAIASLKTVSDQMSKNTEFKNIKIHIHTKENKSFLRNWEPNKHDDNLTLFRDSVVWVNKTLKPITSFEFGKAGLFLRAITPIINDDKSHIGSLEFIQSVDSVAKALDKMDIGFLLLMNKNINNNLRENENSSLKNSKKLKNFIISQKTINNNLLNDIEHIDIKKLFKNSYFLSSKYFYTHMEIKDFQNKKLGVVVLSKPLSSVNNMLDKSQTLIYISLFGILVMTLIISFVIMLAVKILITGPLKIFEDNLLNFFLFLQGKKDYIDTVDIDTDDEFGKMAKSLKENIAVSAKLHEDINHLNENLEHEVEEKTKEVTALLNNAGQGFLSFGCDFIIDDEYSAECIKLLGKDIAGKDIAKLLFSDKTKIEFFKSTILDINEMSNNTIKRSLLSLLPMEIVLNKRALKLEYRLLDDNQFMMIITNISAQKKLENKIKKEQKTLKMIVEIITENDTFFDIKKDYEDFINNYEKYIDSSRTSLSNINDIYILVHTFKGTFSQLYMDNIVQFLHSIESELSNMLKKSSHTNEELLLLLKNSNFKSSLQNELDVVRTILGDDFFAHHNYIKVDLSIIKTLEKDIHDLFKKSDIKTPESKNIIIELSNISNQKLFYLLKQYPSVVEQVAERLQKNIYDLKIVGDKSIVVRDEIKPFLKTLVHVFKNAADHGIESSQRRIKNSKDPKGTISCNFEQTGDIIKIIISDDGAGIDREKVLQKALSLGMTTEEKASLLSDEEMYEFIFSEQFSTKDEITDISGRGVGMNAVKQELEKIGGTIKIETEKNVGTTFIFTVPQLQGEI